MARVTSSPRRPRSAVVTHRTPPPRTTSMASMFAERNGSQWRLTVRGKGDGDAVHQDGRAAGEAWVPEGPRMPEFIARSWLPVPLFSGALTPGMQLSTSHGGCAGFGEISRRIVTRASMFKYVVFTRIAQPVADHGQGIFFLARARAQRPAVISQRFYLQSAAVQQLLRAALGVVISVQGRCSRLPRVRLASTERDNSAVRHTD